MSGDKDDQQSLFGYSFQHAQDASSSAYPPPGDRPLLHDDEDIFLQSFFNNPDNVDIDNLGTFAPALPDGNLSFPGTALDTSWLPPGEFQSTQGQAEWPQQAQRTDGPSADVYAAAGILNNGRRGQYAAYSVPAEGAQPQDAFTFPLMRGPAAYNYDEPHANNYEARLAGDDEANPYLPYLQARLAVAHGGRGGPLAFGSDDSFRDARFDGPTADAHESAATEYMTATFHPVRQDGAAQGQGQGQSQAQIQARAAAGPTATLTAAAPAPRRADKTATPPASRKRAKSGHETPKANGSSESAHKRVKQEYGQEASQESSLQAGSAPPKTETQSPAPSSSAAKLKKAKQAPLTAPPPETRPSVTADPVSAATTATPAPAAKKSRPSAASASASAAAAAAAAKLPRENLSEAQKRSNHIQSEQKRRNLIKQGFDDLHRMVPALRRAAMSKSAMLIEAAKFMRALQASNAELAAVLGRPGAPGVQAGARAAALDTG